MFLLSLVHAEKVYEELLLQSLKFHIVLFECFIFTLHTLFPFISYTTTRLQNNEAHNYPAILPDYKCGTLFWGLDTPLSS